MPIIQEPWKKKAESKVLDMKSKIPREWILTKADLEDAGNQRSLTGPYFGKFLGDRHVTIIRNDSVQLVEKIKYRQYTALEVTQAFCHAAAIAQRIVCQCL